MKLTLLLCLLSLGAIAKAPQNFDDNVFVDFIQAKYQITYDLKNKTAMAKTIINFRQNEKGHPLFDFVGRLDSISINGAIHQASDVKSPDSETTYKRLNLSLLPGDYTITMANEITKNVTFNKDAVAAAFWMSDLTDRRYLEQYLPTNLEYDQYKMIMEVKFRNMKKEHMIYTNGELTQLAQNDFKIIYPDYFTASSVYFHVTKKGRFPENKYTYTSINGRQFDVTIYSANSGNVRRATANSQKIMKELEDKLGPWSHPSLVIYIAGQGGMEHSGATITSMSALGHEIIHSFFARGVMPVDGNAGWMDEAIASWRDKGYPAVKAPNFSSTNMAGHSHYKRTTDRRAYSKGANFMAYLNNELSNMGGLTVFLKDVYGQYVHQSINTELFRMLLEAYTGRSFERDFNQYIYGPNIAQQGKNAEMLEAPNPMHPHLTEQNLKDLL
jgi:hypothetical protein